MRGISAWAAVRSGLFVALIATGACKKSGDALLIVHLSPADRFTYVRSAVVTISTVTEGGPSTPYEPLTYPTPDGGFSTSTDVTLGVLLPGVAGPITISVRLYGQGSVESASGTSESFTPRAAEKTDVYVTLQPDVVGDGGTPDESVDGGAGSAGTSGAGGAAGAAGAAGTGGISGAGGHGGAGATGGGGRGGNAGGAGQGGTDGGASGAGGMAGMCAGGCMTGATQCGLNNTLQTCGILDNCPAFVAATCSSGLVCERIAPAACADPNWAEWPMPNSPTDVAAGAPNGETYIDNKDGTITDTVTGLMWQQTIANIAVTQAGAVTYCMGANIAGRGGWRTPSLIELISIVDVGGANPSTNAVFTTPVDFAYWSATSVAGNATSGWGIEFTNGGAQYQASSTAMFVRCVR